MRTLAGAEWAAKDGLDNRNPANQKLSKLIFCSLQKGLERIVMNDAKKDVKIQGTMAFGPMTLVVRFCPAPGKR
jgi:hypothetical protein